MHTVIGMLSSRLVRGGEGMAPALAATARVVWRLGQQQECVASALPFEGTRRQMFILGKHRAAAAIREGGGFKAGV